jgi:hypothetical protein
MSHSIPGLDISFDIISYLLGPDLRTLSREEKADAIAIHPLAERCRDDPIPPATLFRDGIE